MKVSKKVLHILLQNVCYASNFLQNYNIILTLAYKNS